MKGIYHIKNKVNNKVYIGSAVNFERRKFEHLHKLKKGIHHSYYLQKSWDKYGEHSFEILLLEEVICDEDLINREQWWIDNSMSDYNMCKIAGSVLGYKHSDETKEKLSNNQFKGVFGINNPSSKKCYQYSLNGDFIKQWDCITDIEREEGFENSLIVRCLKGKTRTAYKNQWFYEYKGDKINSIVVKECINNIRNKDLFDRMNQYIIETGDKNGRRMAVALDESYNKIRSAYTRYKEKFSKTF